MQRGSIALRLFWFSLAWLIIALAFTAFLLSNLYLRALDDSLKETLEFHLETLVGVSSEITREISVPAGLADPRFSRPASGWYWELRDDAGQVLRSSRSLIGTELPEMSTGFDADSMRTQVMQDGFGTQIRQIERQISLEGQELRILVAGNLDEISALVDNFRGQAIIVLSAVGAMLAIMSAIVGRFALRPLGRLRHALEGVREGESDAVKGSYPSEIAPLAEEINELLSSNTRIIERAKSQVGNLAHGLKTPLAVLRNEAATDKSKLAGAVMEQSEKMNGLVSLYLDRARLSARTALVGRKANTAEILARLVRVMSKLNQQKSVIVQEYANDPPWFRGEPNDLEEMVGNLLDNACKWSRSEVRISLAAVTKDQGRMVRILIEDDGPGLSGADAEQVLKRGVRLDEKAPGSGLGLDIVTELSEVYGGQLNLTRSDLGGLCAELILPAARASK